MNRCTKVGLVSQLEKRQEAGPVAWVDALCMASMPCMLKCSHSDAE